MKPNRKNERFFLSKIRQGILELDRKGNVFNIKTGRFIGTVGTSKYKSIGMKDSKGKVRHILVHRLMWLHFKGPIPNRLEVNHKDGFKSNTKLSNFELVTGSENRIHAYKNGLIDRDKLSKSLIGINIGHRSPCSKLSQKEADRIRKLYRKGYSQYQLADMFFVGKTTV